MSLADISADYDKLTLCGDFNFHLQTNIRDSAKFFTILAWHGFSIVNDQQPHMLPTHSKSFLLAVIKMTIPYYITLELLMKLKMTLITI